MKQRWLSFLAVLIVALVFPALSAGADDVFTIPAGTILQVKLTTTLSTRASENGDPWTGSVVEPIFAKGEEVVPVGSTVQGRVSFVKGPGRAKGTAQMRLTPERITRPDEVSFAISASLEDAQGAEGAHVAGDEGTIKGSGKSKKGTAIETGVGAGAGAGVGAIADGGTGALYGMAIGATAALAHSLLKRHKDVVLPQGTELTLVINRSTTFKRTVAAADASKQ
jgi:hypothetical protein